MTAIDLLVRHIQKSTCIPFIGAGFSKNAKLPQGKTMPNWEQLNKIIADSFGIEYDPEDILRVPSECVNEYGERELYEALREHLHIDEAKPGNAHLALANLGFETVFTTNFESLIEDAHKQVQIPIRTIINDKTLSRHAGRSATNIVKMHGDLEHENIVLTRDTYEAYREERPGITQFFECMLMTKAPLFIGYSMRDPHFVEMLQNVNSIMGRFRRTGFVVDFQYSTRKKKTQSNDIYKKLKYLKQILLTVDKKTSEPEAITSFLEKIRESIDISSGTVLRETKPEGFQRKLDMKAAYKVEDTISLATATSRLCFINRIRKIGYSELYNKSISPILEDFGLEALTDSGVPITLGGSRAERIRAGLLQSRATILYLGDIQHPLSQLTIRLVDEFSKPLVVIQHKQDIKGGTGDDSHGHVIYDPTDPIRTYHAIGKRLLDQLGATAISIASAFNRNDTREVLSRIGVSLDLGLRRLFKKQLDSMDPRVSRLIDVKTIKRTAMISELARAKILTRSELRQLRNLGRLVNRAIRFNRKPEAKKAKLAIDTLRSFETSHDFTTTLQS